MSFIVVRGITTFPHVKHTLQKLRASTQDNMTEIEDRILITAEAALTTCWTSF